MALELYCLRVEVGDEPVADYISNEQAVRRAEVDRLIAVDAAGCDPLASSDRCLPLGPDRWAIGRGDDCGTTWRIVDEVAAERIPHPAWLWNQDRWFVDGSDDEGPSPPALPLRHQLRLARDLAGDAAALHRLLAAAVAALRTGEKIAIVASEQTLGAAQNPARWFALALLTCLPPHLRTLRITSRDRPLDPQAWDLIVTPEAPEGVTAIRADDPPETDDFVASYLRDLLDHGRPEAAEQAAFFANAAAADPWEAGLKEHLSGTTVDEIIDLDAVRDDPEEALAIFERRLEAGSPMDGDLAALLAELTLRTGDPRPWRSLSARPDRDRSVAIGSWLRHPDLEPPRESLLRAIAGVRPRGALVGPWVRALLGWAAKGSAEAAAVELLLDLVEDEDLPPEPAGRASVWAEIIRVLVERGRHDTAVDAFVSPAARRLAAGNGGRALARTWVHIPSQHWTQTGLEDLVSLVGTADDGDEAADMLHLGALLAENERLAEVVVQRWAGVRLHNAPRERDVFLTRLRGGPHALSWARTIAVQAPPDRLIDLLLPITDGPGDPVWITAEETRATQLKLSPRDRLIAMAQYLPEGAAAVETTARSLLFPALGGLSFPDQGLAKIAEHLAGFESSSRVWMWLAITAAPVDHHPISTVDATIHAFCDAPPRSQGGRDAAIRAAWLVGAARGWTSLDHARWIVRLCMAPDGDGSGFNIELARTVTTALARRKDGDGWLGQVTNEVVQLPPDHFAVRIFIKRLLPHAWPGGAPDGYRRAVDVNALAPEVHDAWLEAIASRGA